MAAIRFPVLSKMVCSGKPDFVWLGVCVLVAVRELVDEANDDVGA